MSRRAARTVARVLAASLVVGGAAILPAAEASAAIEIRRVADGLSAPVAFTFGPGRKIWYVEKGSGQVRIYNRATGGDRLFVDVPAVTADGERGTLGIALHPQYPDTPFVYVVATRNVDGATRNQILRYRDRGGEGVGRRVLVSNATSATSHNGGRILFGPDRMLYAIVGDAQDRANSQDLSDEERGKILRLRPGGGVPSDNPFDDRVFAYGIRNSFGFAFDPETGALWETENGPECNDEVNVIRSGENYGWGPNETCAGNAPENTNQDGPNPVLPVSLYESTIGITGIAFCEGCGLGPQSEGAAFHGAVTNGRITRLELNQARDGVASREVVANNGGGTLSFEVGPTGRIYFSTFGGIFKLVQV
ncbi:MAG TPA: PQQ-dependent sugar dehydrogenase [Actinomycetota bacterium]|nr:PQQ-dependent sugar dehydrogenase [Actinomycetota bacterium]